MTRIVVAACCTSDAFFPQVNCFINGLTAMLMREYEITVHTDACLAELVHYLSAALTVL